jgi:thiamine transporter
MKIFTMLFGFLDETVDLVKIVSFAAIGLVAAVVLILSLSKKIPDARSMALGAVCVALSFALSFIKIPIVIYGGSITLASFVPLLIYSYFYGPTKGLLIGVVYGLLQYIQEPYFISVPQFALDYILAFSSIALAGAFKRVFGLKTSAIVGAAVVGLTRFVFHTLGGILWFNAGFIMPDFPQDSALVYSAAYNAVYVLPDIAIAIGVIVLLLVGGFYNYAAKRYFS